MSGHKKARVALMAACNEIRRLRVKEGLSNQEIMKAMTLDDSTFYRYQQKIIEQDVRELERSQNELLAHQIIILRDRFEDSYHNLTQIAKDRELTAKDRIEAEGKRMEAAINIVKLQKEGPNAIGIGHHRGTSEQANIIKSEAASQ